MNDALTADGLLSGLVSFAPATRDAELERLLGISDPGEHATPPGPELIGYFASGLAPIVRALLEVPVGEDDVFIDLGSGLGKVAALARLLSGARVRGIELQRRLIDRAPTLEGVEFVHADVREAPLGDGTVFFLYNPFTGSVLREVLARLHEVARRHALVVCALGLSLREPWLVPRPLEHFWLQVFDSVVPAVPPRKPGSRTFDPRVHQLADER
jgi:SAM-dependent methyltransferase